jgi:hypothetical protein
VAAVSRGLALAGLTLCAGCPPDKPTVELPPISGALTAELVGTLGGPDGPRDPRALVVVGTTLYVADVDGLHLFDLADPAAPVRLGRALDRNLHDVAVTGDRAYVLDINGTHRVTELDVGDPRAPSVTREVTSKTLVFGGLAARPGLLWHAVGSNPPSQLFHDLGEPPCDAPDRERGAMDIWLGDGVAYETIHFDDFAGDGLDGNGGYGLVSFVVEPRTGACPRVTPADILFFDTHARNRSRHERRWASDLQVAIARGGDLLFVTGEQRLRSVTVGAGASLSELGALPLPEALAVAVDEVDAAFPVVAVTNGDLLLIDARDPAALELAAVVETGGVTRAVVMAGDGRHLYASIEDAGIAIVRFEEAAP